MAQSRIETNEEKATTAEKAKSFFAYTFSALGGLGIALQNFMAVGQLINTISNGVLAVTAAGQVLMNGLAIAVGGLCSGIMNFMINVPLLKGFMDRLANLRFGSRLKGWHKLSNWQKFTYWAGIGIFITSGIMLGLTAFAFGPIGVLAAIGIAAGILVALISTVQELETWLDRFDDKEKETNEVATEDADKDLTPEQIEEKKKQQAKEAEENAEASLTLTQRFIKWKDSLTKGKVIGFILTIGNVVALSLLMAMGVAAFMTGVGVPALPALIAGIGIAFTAGAFTEYYFYSGFLGEFCNNFKEKWEAFKNTKLPGLGFACVTTNALVTGVLTYVGITMIAGLILAAGVAVPPIGIIIAVAALAAVFAATASFLLGLDFWSKNMKKEEAPAESATAEENDNEQPQDTHSTDFSLQKVFDQQENADAVLAQQASNDTIPAIGNVNLAPPQNEAPAKSNSLAGIFANDEAFTTTSSEIPKIPQHTSLPFLKSPAKASHTKAVALNSVAMRN